MLATIKIGKLPQAAAFDPVTRTVYVANTIGRSVSVIDATRCNAVTTRGCGRAVKTVRDRFGPDGVDVDVPTDTVYVANNAFGDSLGTVSVINGATCNGTDTSGCNGHIRTVPVGRSPLLVVADARTDIIYITDFSSAAVSVLNGSKCNAAVTSACGRSMHQRAVGSLPFGLAVNQRTNTVYVTQTFQSGSMSIFRGVRHWHRR